MCMCCYLCCETLFVLLSLAYFQLRDDVMLHDNGGCMHTFNER